MVPIGTQLGPYQVLALLGAGGMGEVYRARDTRLDRDVAIKVLPEPFAKDANRLARFEREAKAVAALSHPNILAIYDCGQEHGLSFAVTELLDGETLHRRVTQSAIPWRKAAEIGVAIADGLAAAHAKGIIHRDLKPENLFLTADGRVKILDFGLARVEPPAPPGAATGSYHAAPTETGSVMGTIGYMSPEQVRGQPVDARSDIFALGCVLYEMVTGQRAFARPTGAETMTAILHDEPLEMEASGKKVPLEVDRLIRHCLEKNPAARFHSAHDLAFALRAILTDSGLRSAAPAASVSRRRLWIAASLLVLLGLGTAGYLIATRDWVTPHTPPAPVAKGFQAVAVLPFENVGGDLKTEPLSDGLADDLIESLRQVRGRDLKVRPFTSVSRYKRQRPDVLTMGRELNVPVIVTGTLHQQGDDLAISVELVDARENDRLWGKRYSGKVQGIVALQDAMAKDIAVNLGLQLTDEEVKQLTRHATEDVEALLLYNEGRYHWSKFTPEGAKVAMEYFERALKKDPKYARAYGGLASCYTMLGNLYLPPREAFPKAKALLVEALKLDDTLARSHTGLAFVYLCYDWDWALAEKHATRAIQLDPNDAVVQDTYLWYLLAMGRVQEALATAQRAAELDPLTPLRQSNLARVYIAVGQYDAAIMQARKALHLADKFFLARCNLGLALARKEQYPEAVAELQRARADSNDHPWALGHLGAVYALSGRPADARQLVAALQRVPSGYPVRAYSLACITASLGEKDQAFAWLGQAREERGIRWLYLKIDPFLEPLRSDARFTHVLHDMGLADKAASRDQPIDTLAVLPFDNLSADAEAGYLGDDITFSLTEALMRLRDLKVRPYTSAARHKGKDFDARTAGKALDVQAVVKGVVNKRGEQLVVIVDVVDVREGDRPIVTARYEGLARDRLSLQQKIATELPEKLRLTLSGQEKQALAKLPTQSLTAHELYIQGRVEWNNRTEAALQKAIQHFEQAIYLDPNYALAYAGLADCYVLLERYGRGSPERAAAKAKDAAQKALERDPTLAEPLCTLAHIQTLHHWDFAAAERGYRAALERKPHYATGRHWYGLLLSSMGRHEEAISQLQMAQQLDRDSLIIRNGLGRILYMARKFDAAEAELRATLEQAPQFVPAMAGLGKAYLQQKRYPEVIKVLRNAWERDKNFILSGAALGYAHAASGHAESAREVLQEMQGLAQQRDVSPVEMAVIHVGLGEKEEALKLLEQGHREGAEGMIWIKVDPLFDSLRGEPRFQKLLADMKLPP